MTIDKFYTPDSLATLLMGAVRGTPDSCVDPACGSGALLQAAEDRFGDVDCFGSDVDREAVAKARLNAPHWTLSVGNMLVPASRARSKALVQAQGVDLVVCNPPFSMGSAKGVCCEFLDGGRCSVAMAHLLAAHAVIRPTLALAAIVPESLMYSDLDAAGRNVLEERGVLRVVSQVNNTAFKGARAHTLLLVVDVKRRKAIVASPASVPRKSKSGSISCSLARGTLALHDVVRSPKGVPLVHTTKFEDVVGGSLDECMRVRQLRSGVIEGNVILLPRVGVPQERHCKAVRLPTRVQLSACVFGLTFSSARQARMAAARLRGSHAALQELYRGTGARYVTRARLIQGLARVGIAADVMKWNEGRDGNGRR